MTTQLLRTRRFLPLFLTQALGALNDNLFKNALVVLVVFRSTDGAPGLVALASGLFILPYALFSAVAGQLADRLDKSLLIRWTKAFEVAIMLLAAAGFLLDSVPALMAVLFCIVMGAMVMALRCRHQYGRLLALGIGVNFCMYVFVNIAMVMGAIPVGGVPLPLVSHGGSAMLTVMFGFGLLMSVHVAPPATAPGRPWPASAGGARRWTRLWDAGPARSSRRGTPGGGAARTG